MPRRSPSQQATDGRPFAFVLMPFSASFDDVYRVVVKDAAEETNFLAERLDEQMFAEGMLERIYRQIESADVIIADMTGQNANVFYEIGYAHAREKLCILMTADASDIPFDLKHRRHIVYGKSVAYLRTELAKHLVWARSELDRRRTVRIRVEFQEPSGTLNTTEHSADANVRFAIDLHNDSDQASPEISAVYFYASADWRLFQNGHECAVTEADLAPFKFRYFLAPPVQRLQRNSWAQLTFRGERRMATSWNREKIMNEYKIAGESLLRIITNEGTFDYRGHYDFEVRDLPF